MKLDKELEIKLNNLAYDARILTIEEELWDYFGINIDSIVREVKEIIKK